MTKLINKIVEWCEISPKAIVIIEQLNHFIKTEEDCIKFIHEFEARQLWKDPKKPFKMLHLAEEIGAYHYPSKSLDELLAMDTRAALEHLFMEPINWGKLQRFNKSKLNFVDIFTMKQQQPKMRYMEVFIYA
ncbi:hypothetical protein [Paenibacillus vini]|uniref:Uncharacterized protein n=1 Tax=Paenibacillus vini TaxID=1476024 RepID=A0ABQ4M996_9BACL|nr:hypothetical protein [Paenibacillus vini]GIP52197.1 hypothetical protein J42TS3_12320 [Paenibacillus vini]